MYFSTPHRTGTILIIVAGVSALLASLAITFLSRMRNDVQESQQMMQEAQARIMLSAACCYIMEASRLGYDTTVEEVGSGRATENKSFHLEGHGWIDVRDGTVGPKVDAQPATTRDIFFLDAQSATTPSGNSLYTYRPNWGTQSDTRRSSSGYSNDYFPIGSSLRVDMYRKKIPPYAIRLDAAPNPINPENGVPYLSRPDPMPLLNVNAVNWKWNQASSSTTEKAFDEFKRGDPTPVANSINMSWFRLHRCGPSHPDKNYRVYNAATFVVTVGVGGTNGFRSFGNDPLLSDEENELCKQLFQSEDIFNAIQANELRQWYLVEWSPAVGGQLVFNLAGDLGGVGTDGDGELFQNTSYAQRPQNRSRYNSAQGKLKSFGGTIRFVQRLKEEPKQW